MVSSQNIANILAVVGVINLGSSCLFLHPSLAASMDAFLKLRMSHIEEDEVNTVGVPVHFSCPAVNAPSFGGPLMQDFVGQICGKICMGSAPCSS
jgi:hypothetical protein